ncbi:IS66 family insertion sequence element accessory protein TnpA [Proteiniphilum propionicum]|uniref:IS66 family insertion sequence element accessory protein TnpA n=1 Tax=Proteiniphilum propionicum TaxID=2829812 RepID=UPI001EEA5445|nr:transposase [Proteiniphilum propionicum]ULB33769.1 IS66 family insertion sequence element accessory protein TnpB [Proteiniphilum propionicum]
MTPISKEEFMVILKRQQESGLSVKDFCENQSYTASSFYYWKSKFGLTRPYNNHAHETAVYKLAPISFNLSENKPALKTVPSVNIKGEIKIKLPGGIQVSFIGSTQTEAAIKLLAQICSAHVLPK